MFLNKDKTINYNAVINAGIGIILANLLVSVTLMRIIVKKLNCEMQPEPTHIEQVQQEVK